MKAYERLLPSPPPALHRGRIRWGRARWGRIRWGLLERSPQTPKNFSRELFGWGFTLAPGPVVPLLYRMVAGILGFAESA